MRILSIIVVLLVVAGGTAWALMRQRDKPVLEGGPAPAAEITFICRETRALSRGPRQATPAVNPKTGRSTLVQALYCANCKKWYPEPPAALKERMSAGPVCPKTGGPLVEIGPAGK